MMAGARSVIINLIANDRVTDTVKGIGKQFDKLNQQIGKMAAPAMAAAGAAAGGAFVAGIAGAIQLDSARGKLEAQLGLTKDQSKRVGDVAGRVFSQAYGESMEEVQGAITSVIQNMDGMRTASNAALEQTTKRALDVATVMDEEVGSVTRAVSQMLKTGLAKNAQEAFDILTAGTQRGANKAQDLLDTFNEYSTQFRDMGLSGQQAMGILQQGLQGGARDADLVADALKEMNIRVQDLSAGPALKKLGLDADAMSAAFGRGGAGAAKALDTIIDRLRAVQDPTERYQLAQQILGTQSEDLAKAFLKIDPSSAVKALGQVGGAADRAGQALGGTAQARFTAFTRTLQQDVMGALGATVGWFQKHTTVAKVLAAAVGTLVAAYLTYNAVALVMAARLALVTEGTVANTIVTKVAAAATKVWAATTWLLNGAMAVLTSPITLVVVAIGLLVAAVVLAYKKNETFRNVVQAVWAGIKAAIGATWAFLRPVFSAIGNVVGKVLPVALTFLRNTAKIVWVGIQIAIKVAWMAIRAHFMAIKAVIMGVVAPVFRWLWNNVIKPVWSGISAAIKWAWTNHIRPVFNSLKAGVSLVASGFRVSVDAIKKHWDRIKDIAKKPVNFVLSVYNRGIVDVVNRIAKFAGLDTRLSPIKMLARGGTLANPAAARPMKTNGATAIVGEGRRCIARGTLIETASGKRPIEEVAPGERVLTRDGYLLVKWSGLTRPDAEVLRVSTASGDEVVCTPDHRIWTARGTSDGNGRRDSLGSGTLRGRGLLSHHEDPVRWQGSGAVNSDDRPGCAGEVPADRGLGQSLRAERSPAPTQADLQDRRSGTRLCEARDGGVPALAWRAAQGSRVGDSGAGREAGCGGGVSGEVLQAWARLDSGEHLHEPARHSCVSTVQEGTRPRMDAAEACERPTVPRAGEGQGPGISAPEACWREARGITPGDWVWVLADGELRASQVTEIVPAERVDTYDLEVEHEHEFVAGGVLVHNSHPEYVIPTDPAYRKRAQALWAAAGQDLAGRGGGGKNRLGGEGMFFAKGGIIGSFMKGLGGFNFLDPAKAFKGALSKLVGQVPGGGVFRDAVAGVPGKLIGYLLDWFKAKVGFGGGGAGVGKALSFAKAQDGKPYGWGAVGPGAYDCSGLWSAIVNVIKGRNPYSRLFSTFGFTGASAGPEGFRRNLNAAVRVGVTNAGVGHMAGTIRKTNIESSGGAGVRFGGGARGADDPLFSMRYGLKADTGALSLAPGWNPPVFNGTGRPEYLETPRRGGGQTLVVELDGREIFKAQVPHNKEYVRVKGRGSVQTAYGSS